MTIPEDIKYTNDHEWLRIAKGEEVDGKQIAYIGITEFAQQELGDIVFVEIETVGDELQQGDIFGAVEAVKTVSDLFMPINGTVIEKNAALDDEPELVNSDPYGKGWMIKISMADSISLSDLLDAKAYADKIGG